MKRGCSKSCSKISRHDSLTALDRLILEKYCGLSRKRILACILKYEERKVNQVYCNAVISQHVLHLTFLPLFSPSLQTLSPWVGLRKINVSYWGWEDMSPFTNTSLRWLPGEPSDSGFCAYLERAHVAGLKANPCTATSDGLICEKPAGEKE